MDPDLVFYGLCCTPCAYGENSYKVTKFPSCMYYTFAYSLLSINGCMIGATIGNAILPYNIYMMLINSLCFSNALVSIHAGAIRTKLRYKYDIDGSISGDHLIHYFCSPCAIIQESHIIRNNNEIETMPIIQKMEK